MDVHQRKWRWLEVAVRDECYSAPPDLRRADNVSLATAQSNRRGTGAAPSCSRVFAVRSLLAPLSSNEEVTFRRVAIGATPPDRLTAQHLKRLEQLKLIASNGVGYELTPLGRQRYNELPRSAGLASDGSHERLNKSFPTSSGPMNAKASQLALTEDWVPVYAMCAFHFEPWLGRVQK